MNNARRIDGCSKPCGSADIERLARAAKLRWQRIEQPFRYFAAGLTLWRGTAICRVRPNTIVLL